MTNDNHTPDGRPAYGPRDFNPLQWTTPAKQPSAPAARPASAASPSSDEERVRALVEAIERANADIASSYDDWLRAGFALASSLGETGRDYFHRIARLSPKYDAAENDRQYSLCLRGGNGSVKLGTLFHMAQSNSVEYANDSKLHKLTGLPSGKVDTSGKTASDGAQSTPKARKKVKDFDKKGEFDALDDKLVKLYNSEFTFKSTFSDRVNPTEWPIQLRPVAAYPMGDAAHTDKMLLASLALISGVLPNVCGTYGGQTVFPPLYFIFCGPAASRKGEIGHCQGIIKPLCREMRGRWEQARRDWQTAHDEWQRQGGSATGRSERGPEPEEPPYRTPLVPANSTASAAYRQLACNEGWGIMFDTEADTVTQALTSDYGDYSTALRKAFHHETISMSRVKDNQLFEVENPRLAVVLTCTPGQLKRLFPTFENGLGSRFLFYGLSRHLEWIDPFAKNDLTPEVLYATLGETVLHLRHALEALGNRCVRFRFTDQQVGQFNAMFSSHLIEQFAMLGDGITSFVFRMGLSAFRIAMVLSVLRHAEGMDEDTPLFTGDAPELVCSDTDFRTTLLVMEALVGHTARVYARVAEPEEVPDATSLKGLTALEAKLYAALPQEFSSAQFFAFSERLGLKQRNGYRVIGRLLNRFSLLRRVKYGMYAKVEPASVLVAPAPRQLQA